jgi:hypothetical protein
MLPAGRFPDRLNDDETHLENSFVVPDATPADVPEALQGDDRGCQGKSQSP